jgi:hypothetical protein
MSRKRIAVLAIALLAVTILACNDFGGSKTLPIGESAPNFGVKVGDKTTSLDDFEGRVVVVAFWSST